MSDESHIWSKHLLLGKISVLEEELQQVRRELAYLNRKILEIKDNYGDELDEADERLKALESRTRLIEPPPPVELEPDYATSWKGTTRW